MLVWTLVPFYWMIATSLKKDKEIYGFEATLIPRQPTSTPTAASSRQTPFVKYLRNSTIIAREHHAGVAACSAASGAYALARLRFPGRGPDRARPGLHVPGAAVAAVHPALRGAVDARPSSTRTRG